MEQKAGENPPPAFFVDSHCSYNLTAPFACHTSFLKNYLRYVFVLEKGKKAALIKNGLSKKSLVLGWLERWSVFVCFFLTVLIFILKTSVHFYENSFVFYNSLGINVIHWLK